MTPIEHYLLQLAILLIAALAAHRVAQPLHVPDVVTLLVAGMILGKTGLHWLDLPADLAGVQILVVVGAAYILFRGGMALELRALRSVLLTVSLLATLGVLVTAAITALSVAWVFGLSASAALLVASVVAATDPATLIPVLEHARVRPRLTQTIVAESASNDATGAILTFSVLSAVTGAHALGPGVAGHFVLSAGGGIAVGVAGGAIASLATLERRWFHGTTEIVSLSMVIGTYAVAEIIGASGYMAAFVAGITAGTVHLRQHRLTGARPQRHVRLEHFLDTLGELFRLLLFMLLGSQIDLRTLGSALLPALLVVLVLMLVARPLAVLVCAVPDRWARWSVPELLFLAWSRETGVIPAALVAALVAQHAPHLREITAVTTVTILVTVLVQGSTAGLLAERLNLTTVSRPSHRSDLEAHPDFIATQNPPVSGPETES